MNPLDTGQYMHTGLFSKENPLFQPITKKIAPNSKQVKSLMSPFNQEVQFLFLEQKNLQGLINIMTEVMITDDISE